MCLKCDFRGLFGVAVHEGNSVHRLFTFGLEAVDGDKIAVSAFEHQGRAETRGDGRIANDGVCIDEVCFEDDAGLSVEFIFGLREALVGDDLAEDLGGGVRFGVKQRVVFAEFGGESGFSVVLRKGRHSADLAEICDEPFGASGGKSLIDGGFVEGKIGEGGLVIDGAGIHSLGKLHDGIAKVGVASENGAFDRRGTAVGGELGRVEVDDTLGGESL